MAPTASRTPAPRPVIAIVGGGFAGLWAARALRRVRADVVLIDRQNHHLFQPLLYQVATAALSPAHIAAPIRKVLSRQRNARVVLASVTSIDPANRTISTDATPPIHFDFLILATGVTHSYFGHDEWSRHAPGLKSIDDALEIRRRFLLAFEAAEVETDAERRRAALTFVVVGGGPTGVELAGAMAEISRTSIPRDFRSIDTRTARVILVEAQGRLLSTFPEDLSARAQRDLENLGVQVWLNTRVTSVDDHGATIGAERLEARNVFWAAGVRASPLGAALAEAAGAKTDSAGRVLVERDLSIPGHPHIFVVGDLASVTNPATGEQVPGVAQGAMQMGTHAARIIARQLAAPSRSGPAERAEGGLGGMEAPVHSATQPSARPIFHYHDKGTLATIGRGKAVGVIGRLHVRGMLAFQFWAFIHILFLIGFRSRLIVLAEWIFMYFFYSRGARLITRQGVPDAGAEQPDGGSGGSRGERRPARAS